MPFEVGMDKGSQRAASSLASAASWALGRGRKTGTSGEAASASASCPAVAVHNVVQTELVEAFG